MAKGFDINHWTSHLTHARQLTQAQNGIQLHFDNGHPSRWILLILLPTGKFVAGEKPLMATPCRPGPRLTKAALPREAEVREGFGRFTPDSGPKSIGLAMGNYDPIRKCERDRLRRDSRNDTNP